MAPVDPPSSPSEVRTVPSYCSRSAPYAPTRSAPAFPSVLQLPSTPSGPSILLPTNRSSILPVVFPSEAALISEWRKRIPPPSLSKDRLLSAFLATLMSVAVKMIVSTVPFAVPFVYRAPLERRLLMRAVTVPTLLEVVPLPTFAAQVTSIVMLPS